MKTLLNNLLNGTVSTLRGLAIIAAAVVNNYPGLIPAPYSMYVNIGLTILGALHVYSTQTPSEYAATANTITATPTATNQIPKP